MIISLEEGFVISSVTLTEPHRSKAERVSVLIAILAAAFGLMWGMDVGAIAGALLFLKKVYAMTPLEISFVTSAVSAGTVVGALTGGMISDALGRKRTMLGVALIAAICAFLSAAANSPTFLLWVRLVLGYVLGVTLVVSPSFISESTRAELRGRLIVIFQLCISTGIAVSYFVDLGFTGSGTWRAMIGAPMVPAVILFVLMFFVNDTPRWYVMKGRTNDALRVLGNIYGESNEARSQLQQIETDLAQQAPQGSLTALFRAPLSRATLFGLGAGFFLQATGIEAIVYYSPLIIKSLNIHSTTTGILFTALFQVLAILSILTAFATVDRVGRRPVMMTGAVLMVVGLGMLAATDAVGRFTPTLSVVALVGLAIFHIGNSGGFGALIYIFATELFPTRYRAKGAAATMFVTQGTQLAVSLAFPPMLAGLGGLPTFGIFMILAIGAFFFVYFLAPEFKGHSLEEVRAFWENGGRWAVPGNTSTSSLSQ